MRKSRKETAETRERIVRAASKEFRRNGIDRTGLNDLMSAAGLTHGGFYSHFESKEQVVAESIEFGINSMFDTWRRALDKEKPEQGLKAVMSGYLSPELREDFASGCPFASLASEMARSGESVRAVTTEGFSKMVDLIAEKLPLPSRAAARKEALWIFSSMIGAIVMSRVVDDPAMSDTILREARKHLIPAA